MARDGSNAGGEHDKFDPAVGVRRAGGTAGTLYVCGTPIGNLGDVTPRLRETLASVDVIACEDTRRTRTLLSALEVPTPRLLSYRSDNERASAGGVVELLVGGNDVALVTDAGMPSVSDPGVELVRAAHDAGVHVVTVPGPSALDAALSVAGARGSRITFVGFLPRTARNVCVVMQEHADCVLVAFEAPNRVADTLAAVASVQPERVVVVARELTKRHEQVRRGPVAELAADVAIGECRGEHVLVFDPMPTATSADDAPSNRDVVLVQALVEEGMKVRTACKVVATHSGARANALYEAVVESRS